MYQINIYDKSHNKHNEHGVNLPITEQGPKKDIIERDLE